MSNGFGGSWWGQRWIEALERLSTAWQNRLPRGRDYAKKGHVISLSVSSGKIAARVQGSRSKPYVTTIEVPALRSSDWDLVIETLASESRFAAQLLIGIMPSDIDDAFAEHNVNLFPVRNSEMLGSCTCPDKARPCKHIAAVHYAFGQALDRDPFLLFQVRGADRQRLLRGFNLAWFGEDHVEEEEDVGTGPGERGLPVMPLDPDAFNLAPEEVERMSFAPLAPEAELLILDRLGAPRSWSIPLAIEDLLGPVFIEATRTARQVALAGFDEESRQASDSGEAEVDPANADGFTSLALMDEPEPLMRRVDAERPTFVLPKSLNVATRRIAKAPVSAAPEEKKPVSRVKVRKGVASRRTAKARSAEPTAPKPKPRGPTPLATPDDFVEQAAAQPAAPVLVRRGKGVSNGPAIVRRRGSGSIEIVQDANPEHTGPSAEQLRETCVKALGAGEGQDAVRAASGLWAAELSLDAFLLLMTAARMADRVDGTLQAEAARLLMRARERNFVLTTPAALLLLCAGELKPVADQVFALGKKSWRDDGPAGAVLLYAAGVLAGENAIPDDSHLAARRRAAMALVGDDADVDTGSVGSWIAWAISERPPPPTSHERLIKVARELAMWALGSASAVGGPATAAAWACAVAEAFELSRIEGGGLVFLASLREQINRKKRLTEAMERAVGASPVLG